MRGSFASYTKTGRGIEIGKIIGKSIYSARRSQPKYEISNIQILATPNYIQIIVTFFVLVFYISIILQKV
jgi:hypothetical protein